MIPRKTVITLLIFCAVLLSCVLALQQLTSYNARADSSSRAGRYVVATTILNQAGSLLWVANVDTQTLTVFGVDMNGIIYPFDTLDLQMVFTSMYQPGMMPGFAPRTPIRSAPPTNPQLQSQTTPPPVAVPPPGSTGKVEIKKKSEPNIIR